VNTKFFDVAEYVLPKFEISITGQTTSDKVVATVTAKYTFGKPVDGTLICTATSDTGSAPVKKVVPIAGTANVEFTLDNDLGIYDQFSHYISLSAEVLDKLSGMTQLASTSVRIEQFKYIVEFLDSPAEWKKGLPYTVKVKVTNIDGTPVQNTGILLRLTFRFGVGGSLVKSYPVRSTGIVIAVINVPKTATQLAVTVSHKTGKKSMSFQIILVHL
jgi:uncharacterized protein YfaS (alpha-2-macroglobulin family)